jgi:hypothetical protein
MAFCENCGSEVREGAWVCGHCGAPMQPADATPIAASDTTNPYVFSAKAQAEPAYQPPQSFSASTPAQPAATGDKIMGLSKLTFAVVVAAVVAVGLLALWFLFFNNGDGSKYLGTWAPVTSVSGSSAGLIGDGGRLIVAHSDGRYTVTAIDGKGQTVGPLKASLKHGKLEFGLEYAGGDQTQQLKLQLVKAFVGMLVKDFHATLSSGGTGTVYLSYSGKAQNDLVKSGTNAVQLRRVSP